MEGCEGAIFSGICQSCGASAEAGKQRYRGYIEVLCNSNGLWATTPQITPDNVRFARTLR